MKNYDNYLSKYYKVRYIEYKYKCNEKECYIFDPIDKIKLKKYKILESPNFLLTNELMEEYRKKTKSFFFS